jgi:ABC-2 type transport system ATP-binding protein
MSEMIEISDLSKEYFGKKVVDCLSLDVNEGELFGFLGPNGAGKTTTIRIMTTLTKPTSGRVLINGIDVVRDPFSVKAEFGVVQQHLSLNRDLTIAENLELHARLHHIPMPERKERISELLDYVELSDPRRLPHRRRLRRHEEKGDDCQGFDTQAQAALHG